MNSFLIPAVFIIVCVHFMKMFFKYFWPRYIYIFVLYSNIIGLLNYTNYTVRQRQKSTFCASHFSRKDSESEH